MHSITNPDMIQDVTNFMLAMGQSRQCLSSPEIPGDDVQLLRSKLNREEFSELDLAWCRCKELRQQMETALLPETPEAKRKRLAQVGYSTAPPQQRIQEIATAQIEALADLADGIGDLIYVLVGMANAYGIPLATVWREIQRANMAKLWTDDEVNRRNPTDFCEVTPFKHPDGSPLWCVRSADGKVRKPPSFTPPNIKQIIIDAINQRNPHPGEPGFVPASKSPHEKTITP